VGRLEDGEKLAAASSGSEGGSAAEAPASVKLLGMTLSSMSEELRTKFGIDKDLEGAVVTEVVEGSAAAEKRLEPGDVITEAGEEAVQGAADVTARADAAKKAGKSSLLILIAKGGKSSEMRFIALKIKD
jgi:serine protease Do